MILADRSARRTELVAMNSIIAEGRQNLLQEGQSREALESRRVADMAWLSERIEAMEKARAESPQTTATSRLQQLEHRSMDMDRKLADISRREVLHYDELRASYRNLYSGKQDRSIGSVTRPSRMDEAKELFKASHPLSPNLSSVPDAAASNTSTPGSVLMPSPPFDVGNLMLPQQSQSRSGSMKLGPRGSSSRSVSPPMSLQAAAYVAAPSNISTPTSPPAPVRRISTAMPNMSPTLTP